MTEFFPDSKVLAKQVTEFVEINGHRIPKHIYLNSLNRKQRRQFEIEVKKKNSAVKLVRVEKDIVGE
jgi:hypothetical protein